MQVDTVLSRLTALKERIEATEALIEIDLDHRRNELVAFDLVRPSSSTALLVLHSVHAVCAYSLCMHAVCACSPCVQSVHAVCELGSMCTGMRFPDSIK